MGTRTLTDTVEPWERQPGESTPAFEAFRRYRDQHPSQRSITIVARELDKSRALIGRWSSTWHWQQRVQAYDAEQDRSWQAEQEAARRQAARRQAQAAEYMMALVQQQLADLVQAIAQGTFQGARLNYAQIARWLEVATKVSRLALGEPTEVNQLTTDPHRPLEIRVVYDEPPEHQED